MADSLSNRPELKRTVGLLPLTLIAAGGILGSGWLFSPLLTAQLAGPASIIAWIIGAIAMLLLAFSFAEIASVLPVAGGICTGQLCHHLDKVRCAHNHRRHVYRQSF